MDTPEDIRWQKYAEWKQQMRWAMQDYCEKDCDEHNENCPYHDPEEESWDYEQCFRDREGI